MRMMGFDREEKKKDIPDPLFPSAAETKAPVRSLVRIRFDGFDRVLTYFNDRFDLREGDRVFVSGRLAGRPGIVQSVTTKFKIRSEDFERVIALAQTPVRGTYVSVKDKMLSYDAEAVSPDAFRAWVLPPVEPAEGGAYETIYGDGYAIPLSDPRAAEDAEPDTFARAPEYCPRVGYICVRNGVGRAFVEGRHWYEVEFTLSGNVIEEAYCDCPFPGLCKHLLATALVLSVLSRQGALDLDRDFVLIGRELFFNMLRHNGQQVTV